MTPLSEHIAIASRNVRAANLEADLGNLDALRGFSPGGHVVDAARRIVAGLQSGPRSRAWSVTGPYGAGKSTFALFLAGLLGPASDDVHAHCMQSLRAVDPQLAELLELERRRLRIDGTGLVIATAVARREPTAVALARALLAGATATSRRGRKPAWIRELATASAEGRVDPDLVLRAADLLCADTPLLIVIDELGKTLEFAADGAGEADLYLLQQLAERFSCGEHFGGAIMTLQHLAFEDYLVGAGEARRREWRKVHGRFDDVPFVSDRGHGIRLIADALSPIKPRSPEYGRMSDAATAAEQALARVAGHIAPPSAYTETPSATLPLHPLATLALPALAAQLGQHDRSLVAYVAGDSAASARSMLERLHIAPDSDVAFIRLADLYDFFFGDAASTALGTAEGTRFREIQTRVDGACGLNPLALEVLKTVAVLNLTAHRDAALATADVVIEAVIGPSSDADRRHAVTVAIESLEERGLLTYRAFANEYRVWQGSDFDIAGAVAAAREQKGASDAQAIVLGTVAGARPLRPIVAQRYSQERQVLRFFEARFASDSENLDDAVVQLDGADGLLLYVLASSPAPSQPPAAACADGRPLVVLWSQGGKQVREVALDLAAAREVLEQAPELESDVVARRELRHRVFALQDRLIEGVDRSFTADAEGLCFAGGRRRAIPTAAALSALLSQLCSERFPSTPLIRNEMVNRRDLTSQGAKARRELLERIIDRAAEERLGIEGYGPERAMYEALLRHTGLHAERHGRWGFGPPPGDSDLAEVWEAVMSFLDAAAAKRRPVSELYTELQAPPFGVKDGPIPIILSAALQFRNDDVFLYQDGTFQPVIDAAAIERLLKAPERFAVKRAALLGLRAAVFDELRELVDVPAGRLGATRNASTLAVVRPLMAFVRELPTYARTTQRVSAQARAVLRVLLNATEPDELLFIQLPRACDLPAVLEEIGDVRRTDDFVVRLRSALAELGGSYQRLLDQVADLLREAFAVDPDRQNLREDLRARCGRLTSSVIDPKLRAFLITAGDRALDDTEWLEAIASSLMAKSPASFTDQDLVAFEALLAERAGWFRRLEQLHFEKLRHVDASFDARKVTLTAPDGTELSEIVPLDQVAQQVAGTALDAVLVELAEQLGPRRAQTALLGALVGRVLADASARTVDMATPTTERRRLV